MISFGIPSSSDPRKKDHALRGGLETDRDRMEDPLRVSVQKARYVTRMIGPVRSRIRLSNALDSSSIEDGRGDLSPSRCSIDPRACRISCRGRVYFLGFPMDRTLILDGIRSPDAPGFGWTSSYPGQILWVPSPTFQCPPFEPRIRQDVPDRVVPSWNAPLALRILNDGVEVRRTFLPTRFLFLDEDRFSIEKKGSDRYP